MANYLSTKATIDANIRTNGAEEITGAKLNAVLNAMLSILGEGYQYKGVATPSTAPGTTDARVFYFASESGTYTNFGSLVVSTPSVLYYDTAWHKSELGIGTYTKPTAGIPSTDMTEAVQTSLGLADSAYQKPSSGIPESALASAVKAGLVYLATYDETTGSQLTEAVNAGKIVFVYYEDGDGNGYYLPMTFWEAAAQAVFSGVIDGNGSLTIIDFDFADSSWNYTSFSVESQSNKVTAMSSSSTDTQYPSAKCVNDAVSAKYTKPSGGIPKTDLASAVQTSLGLADSALQEHQSLSAYRTSADQDVIDDAIEYDVDGLIEDIEGPEVDFSELPKLCGQPMMLFGAGTPQESIVPTNWTQFDPETGEGYNWNGLPSALGQTYINTSASSNGRYTAVSDGNNVLSWKNF